eukprot:NODE_366_length_8705_cov_0.466070.p2 type:complete len:290 gc:universal NODE_366_length_8705_cov_0.466070:5725-6594(+)
MLLNVILFAASRAPNFQSPQGVLDALDHGYTIDRLCNKFKKRNHGLTNLFVEDVDFASRSKQPKFETVFDVEQNGVSIKPGIWLVQFDTICKYVIAKNPKMLVGDLHPLFYVQKYFEHASETKKSKTEDSKVLLEQVYRVLDHVAFLALSPQQVLADFKGNPPSKASVEYVCGHFRLTENPFLNDKYAFDHKMPSFNAVFDEKTKPISINPKVWYYQMNIVCEYMERLDYQMKISGANVHYYVYNYFQNAADSRPELKSELRPLLVEVITIVGTAQRYVNDNGKTRFLI